jgi:hypothetical protein
MAVEAAKASASDKDKKEHRPPQGATRKVVWTSEKGETAGGEVISEWIVLRKKEHPAATGHQPLRRRSHVLHLGCVAPRLSRLGAEFLRSIGRRARNVNLGRQVGPSQWDWTMAR